MIKLIDDFLNQISMYKLILYYLCVLVVAAMVTGTLGYTPYSAFDIVLSLIVALMVCFGTNVLFAKMFNAIANVESVYITAFILALVMPAGAIGNYVAFDAIAMASFFAMASKYVFAISRKHIFNPAALGMFLSALLIHMPATWWVAGNVALLPFVLLGGLLVVRKTKRFDLILAFSIVTLLTTILLSTQSAPWVALTRTIIHSTFLFFAFVMLTEPLTMPSTRKMRVIYGALVGLFFAPPVHIASFYFTPEIALLIGNVFAFAVTPSKRYILTLVETLTIAHDTLELVFTSDGPIPFTAGQYIEWTIPAGVPDSRGNRRYFTIASPPTDEHIRLGVRLYEPSSTFKKALSSMKVGDTISVSHVAGDFVLPKNPEQPVVMIAGGIGITPFASQIREAVATDSRRPITLFYSNKTVGEIAYQDIFDEAKTKINLNTIYCITNPIQENESFKSPVHIGYIDEKLMSENVTDYKKALYYISGPNSMVESYRGMLRKAGIPIQNIKTDYFPGFV